MDWIDVEIARFRDQAPIASAHTPPSSWYRHREFFQLEREKIFRRHWIFVGRSDQIEKAGSYLSGVFMDEPYLVLRDKELKVRAFLNVCRHHGAPLVDGEGCTQALVCTYHGWTYGLDGKLLRTPRCPDMKDFDPSRNGLVPLPLEEWGPFIFVNFAKEPSASLRESLQGLEARLFPKGWDHMQFYKRKTDVIACNWKVYVDNYLDGGYHVPILHPELNSQLKLSSYRTEIFPGYSLQTSAGSGGARIGTEALYAWIYPNFMINLYGPAMDINWVIPLSEKRTMTIMDFYFDKDLADKETFIEKSLRDSDQVQEEDIWICERVQKGLASSAYDQGRYAPSVETSEFQFHQLLYRDFILHKS